MGRPEFGASPVELHAGRFDFDASRPEEQDGLPTFPVGRRELPAGPVGLRVTCVAFRSATAQFGPGLAEEKTDNGQLGSSRPAFRAGCPKCGVGEMESVGGRPDFGLPRPRFGARSGNWARPKPNRV
jgi:hypothetical protein